MSKTTTEKLLDRLNELRGLSYPQIGYLYFADIKGDGRNIKKVYVITNEGGGVRLSSLNGRTDRDRCNRLRVEIDLAVSKAGIAAEDPSEPTNATDKLYEVIVGNIGTVLRTASRNEAVKTYGDYKRISEDGYGRAGGEDVTLFEDGEILFEYFSPSTLNESDDDGN